MPKFIDHVDVSPGTTGSWVDVDVSDQLGTDAGSVAGVFVEIVNSSATEYEWGVRKNGSTDDIRGVIEDNGHTWAAIGVDGNDIFEAWIGNTAVNIHIVGYVLDSEGAFFDSAIDKTPSTTGSWQDVDVSGDTGTDTAVCALFLSLKSGSGGSAGNDDVAFRINGSTQDRHDGVHFPGDLRGVAMGLDGSEVCEAYLGPDNTPTVYLVGYLTANFSAFSGNNAVDHSTASTGSYVDTDVSADVPSDGVGVLFEFGVNSTTEIICKIRRNGSTFDPAGNGDLSCRDYGFVEVDSNQVLEQYIQTTEADLWLWGYFTEPTSSAQTISATLAGSSTDTAGEVVLNIVQSSTLAGTSSDSASPQTTDALSASLPGVSTDSATPSLQERIAATLAGTSTDTADPLAIAALVATLDGLSTDSASPTVTDAITATLAGTSTDSGAITLGGVELLAATLAGTSLDSGAISKAVSMSSTLSGTSTDTGDILATAALISTLAGTSTDSATPSVTDALSGTLAGTSDDSALATLAEALSASLDGVSTDSGTISLGNVELMMATLAGVSSDSGAIDKAVDLSGTLAGTSSDTAAIQKLVDLLASLDGVSTDSGAIQATAGLDATLDGTSSDSASPSLTDLLDATLAGTSSDSGAISLGDLTLLTATLAGTSTDSAAPSLTDALAAELAGTSTDTASARRTLALLSTLAGTSSDTGIISLSEVGAALDSDTTALVLKHADATTLVLMNSDSTLMQRLDEGDSEWPT